MTPTAGTTASSRLPLRRRSTALLVAVLLGCARPSDGESAAVETAPEQRGARAEVPELIARGRSLLEAGKPAEAQPLFERASKLDGGSFQTQVWLLRAWMDQGRNNDTLDAIDALRDAGHTGPALDYLYGMAFVRRAEKHFESGVRDESIRLNFEEAVPLLRRATEADPAEYRDAYLPLATAAWIAKDVELARRAIERAVELFPRDPAARLVLGRIAATQLQAATDAAVRNGPDPAVEVHWGVARGAFEEALRLCERPVDDARRRLLLLQSAMELGRLLAWRGLRNEAAEAFATGMAWSPESVDFGLVRKLLVDSTPGSAKVFHHALARGAREFAATFGPDNARDAKLLWWLGTTEYGLGDSAAAIGDLRRALAKDPSFVNAWLYLGLALAAEGKSDEALEAFVTGWRAEPAAMLRELRIERTRNITRLEGLIVIAQQAGRYEEAAVLAEMCAEAAPEEPRHWSNLGLFLRFACDRRRASTDPADEPRWRKLAASSLDAYRRALALAPNDPQLLNDGAVLLQHYLGVELEAAADMYRRAMAKAEEGLALQDLSAEDRARFTAALQNARDNLKELEPLLERGADAQDPPAGERGDDGGRGA